MTTEGESGAGVPGRSAAKWRSRLCAGVAALLLAAVGAASGASAETRSLSLYNLHTKERATIVYKRDGKFDPAGVAKLNHFLRDWRKNKSTKMDPQLFDVLWEAYRQSGATQPINVVCGYRSPETNSMLRRRSKGVAQNSQHVQGKAMDFYIPGVPLAKLRAIGLRLQAGGVGFYPSSGSPFVHLDTASVRHWPKMTRQQLVQVFPNGKTLHIPSDGKPLPGYAEALAAYKARKARGTVVVASVAAPVEEDEDAAAPAAVETAEAVTVPMPRLAPDRAPLVDRNSVVAMIEADAEQPADPPTLFGARVDRVLVPPARVGEGTRSVDFDGAYVDFDVASEDSAPRVPADLAVAMAARDQTVRSASASIPIPPTAIVATVDVTRPLRAEEMTTAVLRDTADKPFRPAPPVLAFASATADVEDEPRKVDAAGIPSPQVNPLRKVTAEAPEPAEPAVEAIVVGSIYDRLPDAELTLTTLDTQGLRVWIASQSTREKRYALLTMPDFGRAPELLVKPEVAFAAGFDTVAYKQLRTDRFDGPLVAPPDVVDLTTNRTVAAR